MPGGVPDVFEHAGGAGVFESSGRRLGINWRRVCPLQSSPNRTNGVKIFFRKDKTKKCVLIESKVFPRTDEEGEGGVCMRDAHGSSPARLRPGKSRTGATGVTKQVLAPPRER